MYIRHTVDCIDRDVHHQVIMHPNVRDVHLRRRGMCPGVSKSTSPTASTTKENINTITSDIEHCDAPVIEPDEGSKISNWTITNNCQRSANNERSMSSPVTPPLVAEGAIGALTIAGDKKLHHITTPKRSFSESSADEFHRTTCRLHKSVDQRRGMWRNELVINPRSTRAQPQRKHVDREDADALAPAEMRTSNALDVAVRVSMAIMFFKLEITDSFRRIIQLEELWLYRYPRMPDIVTPLVLFLSVILGPFCTTFLHFLLRRNLRDFRAATWAWTLALGLNGITTSLLKITVGRPRPDFFYRCFPDGVMVANNASSGLMFHGILNLHNCTGDPHDINEGFKSFPSGHSSFAFCAFSFITFYVGGKLHAFTPLGRGQSWRFCVASTPLILAALVAISRTCDYHHHWQDVVVGGIIGFSVAYYVYRQYYPSVFSRNAHRPYSRDHHNEAKRGNAYTSLPPEGADVYATTTADEQQLLDTDDEDVNIGPAPNTASNKSERSPLLCDYKPNNKWI